MRVSSFFLSLALVGCSQVPGPGGPNVSEGGNFDLRLCAGGSPSPTPYFVSHASSGHVAFASCGDFASDNTTTVSGDARVSGSGRISSPVQISGAFLVGAAVDAPNTLDVNGNFATGGDWTVSSPAHIGGNALVAGMLQHDNTVDVDGSLTVSEEAGAGAVDASPLEVQPTTVEAPIDCSAAPDAHAWATDASLHPDTRAGALLDAGDLANITEPTDLILGCGRYLLSDVAVNNTLAIHVVGPTVVVVRGNLTVAAPMVIDIADGGSLELVIDGSLAANNTLTIGDSAHPATVAVARDIRIASPTQIYGRLLAARSSLAADNTLDVWGALYVGSSRVASPLVVHDGPQIGLDGWAP